MVWKWYNTIATEAVSPLGKYDYRRRWYGEVDQTQANEADYLSGQRWKPFQCMGCDSKFSDQRYMRG